MVNSSKAMLAVVAYLNEQQISQTLGKLARNIGKLPRLTKDQVKLLTTARRLHQRYSSGDYRHDPGEASSILALMEWLVVQHAENEHQHPRTFEFTAQMHSQRLLPVGEYDNCITKVHSGVYDDYARSRM
jgi:hypothetical protein